MSCTNISSLQIRFHFLQIRVQQQNERGFNVDPDPDPDALFIYWLKLNFLKEFKGTV